MERSERVKERERVRESVCVCVREREKERVYVCVRERERERANNFHVAFVK